MAQIQVNGVSLYYREHGSGAPIVGIHGTGSSAAMWADAAPELATRGRTILYDRRGSSRSERPEPYATDVHQQADDAAALIDALGVAPAIVIGRSYGGAIALDLALRYPDRVRALVQLEGDGGLSLSKAAMSATAALEEQVFAAAESDMASVGETLVRTALGSARWEGLPEAAKQMFTANGPAIVAELRGGLPDVTAEELGAVGQPTLLVVARDSIWRSEYAEAASLTAAAMPSARVEWVEGGHAVNPAHPIALDFIDDVLAREEEPCIA
jgi:pimeloyl-ACP methyl ester carboxylesterase